jgi:hypothetical protein
MSYLLSDKHVIALLEAATEALLAISQRNRLEAQLLMTQLEAEDPSPQEPPPDVGMMRAPFGYCPTCGAIGVNRERDASETTFCAEGHKYPGRLATIKPLTEESDDESGSNRATDRGHEGLHRG